MEAYPFTLSGLPLDVSYGPKTRKKKLEAPGEYPYTRSIHQTLYRDKLWTFRQFSGFGSAKDTNKRYKYLLSQGQAGLSVAFDMPTLMGLDSDSPFSEGEVGKCGVAVCSMADMLDLFEGIPVGDITTSMTINAPAAMMLAFYILTAKKQGYSMKQLGGTLQNDMLKEFIAQKEWVYPPEQSLKIVTDTIEFCTKHMPRWNTVSISGYHIREAGSSAVQELAFTLADGFTYVEDAINRGLDVDDFAPRLSFFWNSHIDFFEEIAKFRAARRIWATTLKEKYGAKNPRSMKMKFHTQTAGCSLTAQQPENNIIRSAFEALAGVLGGTQSLHVNSMDEVLGLPTEKAAKISLRTQQIIAHETGVPNVVDPLGGSYFIEELTDKMEQGARDYFKKIDKLGGVVNGIWDGFFQREIAQASYTYQKELESGKRHVVGVTDFVEEDEDLGIDILRIDQKMEDAQRRKTRRVRKLRDNTDVQRKLRTLKSAAKKEKNIMPALLEAADATATLGEMVDELKEVYGTYREASQF